MKAVNTSCDHESCACAFDCVGPIIRLKLFFFSFFNYSALSVMKIKTKHMNVIRKGSSKFFFLSMVNVLQALIPLRQDFLELALILGELNVVFS